MAVFALIVAATLLASEPDGVVATAPATTVDLNATAEPLAPSTEGATQDAVAHGLSTDQQIDRWIAARSTAEKPWGEAAREAPDDRKMHGEVSFGIGTGGYRDYGVAVSLPIGENPPFAGGGGTPESSLSGISKREGSFCLAKPLQNIRATGVQECRN